MLGLVEFQLRPNIDPSNSNLSFTPGFSLGISAGVDLDNRFNGFRHRFEPQLFASHLENR
jgi:hypothetical protein